MALDGGYSHTEAVAAFESAIDLDEGLLNETDPNSDPVETPEEERNLAGEEEIPEPEGDADPGDEEDPDDEIPVAAEGEGEEQSAEGEKDSISSLEALASYFEVEPDDVLANIEVEGADGQPIALGEALSAWRDSEGLLSQRQAQLDEQAAQAAAEAAAQVDQRMAELHAVTKGMIQTLNEEYSDQKLMDLRHQDPDAWAAAVDRKRAIEDSVKNSIAQFEAEANKRDQQSAAEAQKTLAEENQKLLTKKPEWQDMKVRRQAMVAGQKLLGELGFRQEEIDSVSDHRILLLVDMAVKGSRLQQDSASKKVEGLRKRGLKKPSMGLRAQTRRDPENPHDKARAAARARLAKTGDAGDAARLIEGFI